MGRNNNNVEFTVKELVVDLHSKIDDIKSRMIDKDTFYKVITLILMLISGLATYVFLG